jgi:quercetin dioxygenase-like cupin family protein
MDSSELDRYMKMGLALRAALDKEPKLYECHLIKRGKDQAPYLFRYYLSGTPGEGSAVYLHRMVASDPDAKLHDHPWEESTSVVIAGRYIEQRANGAIRVLGPGDVNIIRGTDFHRVLIEPQMEAWSLFLHGPRTKTWGFMDENTGEYYEVKARLKDQPEGRLVPRTDLPDIPGRRVAR